MSGARPAKPAALRVDPGPIPAELKSLPQWVVWRYVWKDDPRGGKWTKVLFQCRSPARHAKVNDPSTWDGFEAALQAYHKPHAYLDGIGFVFAPGDPYAGGDLDHCLSPDGELAPWAVGILDEVNTYAEISPSNTGVKFIVIAKLPGKGTRRAGIHGPGTAVELYDQGRFFTLTGHALEKVETIPAAHEPIERLYAQIKANPKRVCGRKTDGQAAPTDSSDDALLEKARAATYGAEFTRLFDGDITGYPSASEADLALANRLAFWFGPDAARVERVFSRSALGKRDKWQRADYRNSTIAMALEGRTEFYGQSRGANGMHPESKPRVGASLIGNPSEEDAAAWPPLRFEELPQSPPFPVEVFPPALQKYCREAAAALQAPIEFVACAMLAVLSAAIGQSVGLKLRRIWAESALLYIILVGRPGTAKSPTIQSVGKALSEIDSRLRRESADSLKSWERKKDLHDRKPNDVPDPGPEPPRLRAIVKDITRESLILVLNDNPRGVLCDPDEASGWVASFNQYRSKGGSDRQFWLSVYSGTSVSYDRKGGRESVHIPHPFVSMLGGMPPSMLASLEEEQNREDGLKDRIFFSNPSADAYPPQRWDGAELSEETESAWNDVITRLQAIGMERDSENLPRPSYVHLDSEADAAFGHWFDQHADEGADPNFPEEMGGVQSKLKGQTGRLALVLSRAWLACDPDADPRIDPVNADHVRLAVAVASYFKAQAKRVRHEMTGGTGSEGARAVLNWIKRKRKASFREAEVSEDLRRFRGKSLTLAAALKFLSSIGAIRGLPADPHSGPGRKPSNGYEVHPELLKAPENTSNTENSPGSTPGLPIFGIPGKNGRGQESYASAPVEYDL
jgi:hypothetical protein